MLPTLGSAAITAIGEVNGIALACQQPAIVSRARNAVATTAPKTRANGESFENATNTAYLEQGKGRPCPDAATLVKRLDDAEKPPEPRLPQPNDPAHRSCLSLVIIGPVATQSQQSLELLRQETIHIVPRYLLQDPNGRSVTSEEFCGRYQLIAFGYTYCPDICPTTLVEMAAILKHARRTIEAAASPLHHHRPGT